MRRALLLTALVPLVVSCAPSGENPLQRLTTWESPAGDYRIRYLEPPWELASDDSATAHFRIRSNAMAAGVVDGGPGKYDLFVTTTRGDPTTLANALAARSLGLGHEVLAGPREIVSAQGTIAEEVLIHDASDVTGPFQRAVFFPLERGRSLTLLFQAAPPLDTPEVDAMIRAVGIGATG